MDGLDSINAVRFGLWPVELPKPKGLDMTSDVRKQTYNRADREAKKLHDLMYNIELSDKERIARIRKTLITYTEFGYFMANHKGTK